jgi:hypothetical protein
MLSSFFTLKQRLTLHNFMGVENHCLDWEGHGHLRAVSNEQDG